VALADGSIKFLPETVDVTTYWRLMAPADGETLDAF
jgi:hypothetical protein